MAINVSIVLLLAVIGQVLLKHEPLRAEEVGLWQPTQLGVVLLLELDSSMHFEHVDFTFRSLAVVPCGPSIVCTCF